MRSHLRHLVWLSGLGLFLAATATGDEVGDAKAALAKAGVRVLPTGFTLASESDMSRELGKSTQLRRNVLQTQKDLQAAEQQAAVAQNALTQLRVQHTQLSAQLANIDPNDVALNNKLVGALNAIKGQHDLGQQQREKLDEQVRAARAKSNEAREAYIQYVLDTRKLAGNIQADYTQKAADPEIKFALAKLNQAGGKQFELLPSATFQSSLRRLKQLEDSVLSEAIDLRDDGGKTFRVSVVVNGKYTEEMVLDSGASLISFPAPIATKFGLRPTEKDRRIILQLADGREIEGRLMKLASVRVGKFTVDNVECAVLGPEAAMAEPLLGMSFLENFKFEIDAAARKLTMVKVSGSDPPVAKTGK